METHTCAVCRRKLRAGDCRNFYTHGSRRVCYRCQAELVQRNMDRYGKMRLFVVSRRKPGPCALQHNHFVADYNHYIELSPAVLLPVTYFHEGRHNWWIAKRFDFWVWDLNGFQWWGVLITGGQNELATCRRLNGFTKRTMHEEHIGRKPKLQPIFEEE